MACTLTHGSSTLTFDLREGGISEYALLKKATAAFSLAPDATLRPRKMCALRVLEKKELAHDARVYFDGGKLFELVDARSLERDDIPNLGERLQHAGVHWFTEKSVVVDGPLESDVIARAAARPKRAFSFGSAKPSVKRDVAPALPGPDKSAPLRVSVTTHTGKTILLDLDLSDTIGFVKKKIEETEGLSADLQRLIHEGKHRKILRKVVPTIF